MIFRSQGPQFVTSGKATSQSSAALLYQPFFLAPQCRRQHLWLQDRHAGEQKPREPISLSSLPICGNCSFPRALSWLALSISVQSLSRVQLFVTPWTAAHQASLTNSQSLVKLMFTEWLIPSNHFILCRPLLLLPSIFPSIRLTGLFQ